MHPKIKAIHHSLQPMETHRRGEGAKQNLVIGEENTLSLKGGGGKN